MPASWCVQPTSTEEQKSVMEDQFGHYVLKRLLKNLKPDVSPAALPSGFSLVLFSALTSPTLSGVLQGKEFASILLTHIAPALYEFAVTNRGMGCVPGRRVSELRPVSARRSLRDQRPHRERRREGREQGAFLRTWTCDACLPACVAMIMCC
jgi:hypothetical protein